MLIAQKSMSIGDTIVRRGDRITAEIQAMLPPGRIESLKTNRFVEEITDETAIARLVDDLQTRFDKLEARFNRHIEAHKKKGEN